MEQTAETPKPQKNRGAVARWEGRAEEEQWRSYYHVSDTYIALFANFIPFGVWEAIYLLDGHLKNLSDIQPDTIHGDTQAQSMPVFGLAALLGITLMPRIRHWKDLKLYRPDRKTTFTHIDSLFSDTIDWELIRTHLPDMLRVALSIKAGRITPSTLLRKLGDYSKKNRLYQAFRELGCVLRTEFLLKYLGRAELRALIQAATNKSESFNGFAQWAAFGGDGTILTNDRDEQRKIIKYNHLVANCVIFHNVFSLSRVLHILQNEGYPLSAEEVASLSPYLRPHINRFGHFPLDMETVPPELVYDLWTGAWNPYGPKMKESLLYPYMVGTAQRFGITIGLAGAQVNRLNGANVGDTVPAAGLPSTSSVFQTGGFFGFSYNF